MRSSIVQSRVIDVRGSITLKIKTYRQGYSYKQFSPQGKPQSVSENAISPPCTVHHFYCLLLLRCYSFDLPPQKGLFSL